MKRSKKNTILANSRGFTILEVLVALGIFAIGILAVARLQTESTINNTKSRLYSERAANSAGWIEQDMNLDFDDAQLADGFTATQQFDRYNVTKQITSRVTDPDHTDGIDVDNVKRIVITVTSRNDNSVLFTTTYYKAVSY